jgi:hypothetical protein
VGPAGAVGAPDLRVLRSLLVCRRVSQAPAPLLAPALSADPRSDSSWRSRPRSPLHSLSPPHGGRRVARSSRTARVANGSSESLAVNSHGTCARLELKLPVRRPPLRKISRFILISKFDSDFVHSQRSPQRPGRRDLAPVRKLACHCIVVAQCHLVHSEPSRQRPGGPGPDLGLGDGAPVPGVQRSRRPVSC